MIKVGCDVDLRIRLLLGESVAWAVSFGDHWDEFECCCERRAEYQMVETRRAEFRSGRSCARAALKFLGERSACIPVGSAREPVWPRGVVGSITHCDGLRAAALARSSELFGIGIDVEPVQMLPPGVVGLVLSHEELAACVELDRLGIDVPATLLAFCAKEAFYKAWFPITRIQLDFLDVQVSIDPVHRVFQIGPKVVNPKMPYLASGSWTSICGYLVCALSIPRQMSYSPRSAAASPKTNEPANAGRTLPTSPRTASPGAVHRRISHHEMEGRTDQLALVYPERS